MSDQKICPTCGSEYPLSERFCPRDGTALRSSNASGDLVGTIIAERYHILKKLGEGGMGTVYLAEHVKMGRKAALKVMNPGMAQDADAIARFNREAANASRLNHPNACAIYDFGETPEGLIYLAMEFIEGQSLTDLIEKNGALPAPRAAAIIHQSADALAVAHDYGIVHRDLKPDNIMIARSRDGSDVAKVVDFGIAKASTSDAQKVTKTGLVVGTPEYMSPEQLAGDKLDGRSDIYSLGLVAFNCLTGKLPFPSNSAQEAMIMRLTDRPKTLAEMRPDIQWPDELQRVLDKALAREADERYSKASDFGRDIAKAVERMPAAVAAQEGTLVMGAAGAAVPATRVASAAANGTMKLEAVAPAATGAAVATKGGSKMPMKVGAVVVVAGIAFGAMKFLGGNKEALPSAPSTTTTAGGPAGTQASAPASTVTTPDAGAQKAAESTGKSAARPQAPANEGRDAKRGVSAAPAGAAPTPSKGRGVPVTGDALNELKMAEANALSMTNNDDATRLLSTTKDLKLALTGRDLGLVYYVEMLAYSQLNYVDGVCSAGKEAKKLLASGDKRQGAVEIALKEGKCPQ